MLATATLPTALSRPLQYPPYFTHKGETVYHTRKDEDDPQSEILVYWFLLLGKLTDVRQLPTYQEPQERAPGEPRDQWSRQVKVEVLRVLCRAINQQFKPEPKLSARAHKQLTRTVEHYVTAAERQYALFHPASGMARAIEQLTQACQLLTNPCQPGGPSAPMRALLLEQALGGHEQAYWATKAIHTHS